MKVVAYITKCVPVEVEIDDKWKKMEEYADEQEWDSDESQDYFTDNSDEFEEDIGKALEAIGESGYDLAAVHTLAGNYIFEN